MNPDNTSAATDPAALLALIETGTRDLLHAVAWAEDEIAATTARHPGHADLLFHAFRVLAPRRLGSATGTEFVYRGHVRELLTRVIVGVDLRPSTAVEVCLALAHLTQLAPIHGAAAGLYHRMWQVAFPDRPTTPDQATKLHHYEQLYAAEINELEQLMRTKLSDPLRVLDDIQCTGRHYGTPVTCRFTTT